MCFCAFHLFLLICKEWTISTFHYRRININHPENETQIDQEEDGDTTILEAARDSPNP
jgi:hypothetical protein